MGKSPGVLHAVQAAYHARHARGVDLVVITHIETHTHTIKQDISMQA